MSSSHFASIFCACSTLSTVVLHQNRTCTCGRFDYTQDRNQNTAMFYLKIMYILLHTSKYFLKIGYTHCAYTSKYELQIGYFYIKIELIVPYWQDVLDPDSARYSEFVSRR
jgi:hypothetical protein